MEKNVLLAIILSLFVLITFQYMAQEPAPLRQPEQTGQAVGEGPAPAPARPYAPTPDAPAPLPKAESQERFIKIETDLYSAVLSSTGGTVNSWELKRYMDDNHEFNVTLLKPGGTFRVLGLEAGKDFSLSEVDFSVRGGDLLLSENRETGSVVFEYTGPDYRVKRTFTFHNDSYAFGLQDEVLGLPEYGITLGADFGIFDRKAQFTHVGPVLLEGVDREEFKPGKIKAPEVFTGEIKWIGLEDKYFFAAIAPLSPMESARVWKYQDSAAISLTGGGGVHKLLVYAGPKKHDSLKELGVGLEHVVDFGFFSVIARPIFWLLKKFYAMVGNYGWAIVILTIVIRVPFIPIVNKGQQSMKKLQQLQPRMQEIKEKYKNDPKRMQQETMALYRKNKVNPLGGCLPMLLQVPVFFALYKVLLIAIELRNAPWAFWISDLSQKDPYYILPIVMGISMVVQQKMTPMGGDPRQQKIMMFMPVIFTFLFLNFASGLVLYWLVNNLLSIAQQVYVNRKKDD